MNKTPRMTRASLTVKIVDDLEPREQAEKMASRNPRRSRAPGANHDFQLFRGDILGGLTSLVVAIPFVLAFGVASGMGAAAGLYGLIAVGFFASVFGGTRAQISGPTAPLTIAMAVIVTSHAATIAEALTVIVLAGLLQVLLGISRVGRFVVYTPYVVVSGFKSGVGILMFVQALPFLGAPAAAGGTMDVFGVLPEAADNINASALAIGAATLAVGFLWPSRLERFAPGALVALVVGTLIGVLWLNDAPVIGPVPDGLPGVQLGLPSAGFLLDALEPALILALLGSVDSLLTALVADSLTGGRHNPDRELIGQGIGNMAAGLFGGLPGAGGTTSTVINIRTGGRTRASGALRPIVLLALMVFGFVRYIEPIPFAALAGVLMRVAWDIVDWRLLARAHRMRREHLLVMLTTLSLTVFVDLITAVAVGLIAAGMTHARQLQHLELDSVVSVPLLDRTFFARREGAAASDPYAARVGMVALRGNFTVASSHRLVDVIGADIRDHEIVIFDFSDTTYLDDSAAMVIEQLMAVADKAHTEFIVMGLSGSVADTLHTLGVLRHVAEGRVVETLDEAQQIAGNLLDD